jgi:rhomboid protease GluP
MRQTEGSIVCPHCGRLISINEEKCPFCGAWRPGMFGYAPALRRMLGSFDLITIIITVCVVLYVAALALQPEAIFRMSGVFSFLAPGNRALYQLGMTGGAAWNMGWWWTVFTACYLHFGIVHILFNLMAVRNLGPAMADVYGPARTFVIFSVSGAVGFLVSNVATGAQTVGASGSIYGLLAALIVYGRRHGASMMTAQLWQWAILMFAMGFFIGGINNWAHGGGFAGGWVAAEMVGSGQDRRESPLLLIVALGLLAVTVVGFVLSFVKVTAIIMAG